MTQAFPLSPYKKAGNLFFVSGQIGVQGGELVAGGIEAETRQTVQNISALLQGIGLSMENIVAVDVYLSAFVEDYAPMNEVYKELFKEPYPVRTCIGVKDLPRGARVEIRVMAEQS